MKTCNTYQKSPPKKKSSIKGCGATDDVDLYYVGVPFFVVSFYQFYIVDIIFD